MSNFVFLFSRLTAFVMVTFYKVQSFIYIDPKIIEEARKWLECQQRDNGCFKVSGKLYNNYIRVTQLHKGFLQGACQLI